MALEQILSANPEESIMDWINFRWSKGLRVSQILLMKKRCWHTRNGTQWRQSWYLSSFSLMNLLLHNRLKNLLFFSLCCYSNLSLYLGNLVYLLELQEPLNNRRLIFRKTSHSYSFFYSKAVCLRFIRRKWKEPVFQLTKKQFYTRMSRWMFPIRFWLKSRDLTKTTGWIIP